jgi:hypothetical protein
MLPGRWIIIRMKEIQNIGKTPLIWWCIAIKGITIIGKELKASMDNFCKVRMICLLSFGRWMRRMQQSIIMIRSSAIVTIIVVLVSRNNIVIICIIFIIISWIISSIIGSISYIKRFIIKGIMSILKSIIFRICIFNIAHWKSDWH